MADAGWRWMIQDFYGLENYIQICREHWINMHPIIGAGVFVLAVFLYFKAKKKVYK